MIRMLRAGLLMAVTMLATAADLPLAGWALKPGSTAGVSGLRLAAPAAGTKPPWPRGRWP
ncbi:MAG: hypothetical protein IPO28_13480 [Holophagaceae bacterium]|nr:hypothetical protein [Holophagaceae bacterium]